MDRPIQDLKLVTSVLWLRGDEDEVKRCEGLIEGHRFAPEAPRLSFAHILPPPDGLDPYARRKWCLENWGCADDALAAPQFSSISTLTDDARIVIWRITTLDAAPREFAEEVGFESGLEVCFAYRSEYFWGPSGLYAWERGQLVVGSHQDTEDRDAWGFMRDACDAIGPGIYAALMDDKVAGRRTHWTNDDEGSSQECEAPTAVGRRPVVSVLSVEGPPNEIAAVANDFEGASYSAEPLASLSRLFPPPGGLADTERREWQKKKWGTPSDLLFCDRQHDSDAAPESDDEEGLATATWILATEEDPADGFAQRLAQVRGLRVSIAFALEHGWGAGAWDGGRLLGSCFIHRSKQATAAREKLAYKFFIACGIFDRPSELDSWPLPSPLGERLADQGP